MARKKSGWSYGSQYAAPVETRELTLYDLDKMIEQGTIAEQHWLIQELAHQRLKQMAGVAMSGGWEFELLKKEGAYGPKPLSSQPQKGE